MKRVHFGLVFILAVVSVFSIILPGNLWAAPARDRGSSGSDLVIWTYDSFDSEWGPGPGAAKAFEQETGIRIQWVSHGDAGELLSRVLLEGKNAGADIVLGLDQNMADRALASGLFEAYRPAGAEKVFPELVIDPSWRLLPFDYSYFAFVYDSQKMPRPPTSLEELTSKDYEKKIILMDPRTSSPGLGFFAWVREVYGDGWKDYWRRLRPSILTVAGGWSSGYGLFTSGEAPLVLSYTTSPGYHLEYEATDRYQAAIFKEGHAVQIEVAGLLSTSKNKTQAKRFLDFMMTESFQSIIPLTNWMYPVVNIPLPNSFSITPKADKTLKPIPVKDSELNEWANLMAEPLR